MFSRWRRKKIQAQSNTLTTSEDLAQALHAAMQGPAKSGASVTPETAMRQATVYACVRIIAESIAHLPLAVFRRDGESRTPARDMRVYHLLHDRPNEWQTSYELRELLAKDIELRGNGYARIVRNFRGEPDELLYLPADRVVPQQDERTLAVTYQYARPDGRTVTLRRDEVWHVRGMGNGLAGMDPITCYRETVGDAIAQQEHGSRFFSNGAKPLGLLEVAAGTNIGGPAQTALREDFNSLYAGSENAHRTAVLPGGVSYKPVSISNENAQFLESRAFTRTEICGLFRVPPHKVGDLSRATFSNIEHQALEFVTDCLLPRLVRWEQAIGRDLLDDPDLFAKFNVSALLRGDFKSRQEGLQIQRRNGVISANEWRALEEFNPRTDDGGNAYIVEANMTADTGRPEDTNDPE